VTKHIGTRSVQLEMEEVNGRNIRDIGMLLLRKPRMGDVNPTIPQRAVIGTQTHADTNSPMQVGEHIIIKAGPLATTWYCAEIFRIERQWIEVNYYTTALDNYDVAGKQRKISRLKEATFLRTWVLRNSGGLPTTTAPKNDRDRVEQPVMERKNTNGTHRRPLDHKRHWAQC
jgi:hypothetical protein